MVSNAGSARPSSTEAISATVAKLQSLIANCKELDAATHKALTEKLNLVRSIVDAPPTSLAEGGVGSLNMLQDADVGGEGSDPATLEAAFEPGERDLLERDWMILCWFARHDMCEDEMLVLTEKTFRRLVSCYGVENPENCVRFWQYLVKLRQENKRIQSACKSGTDSAKPRERNAGDVVTASAAASQRTKALPSGIASGVYNPEVLSPTAQLWAKAPTERAASLRRSTERATSVAGASKVGSPTSGGRRSAGGGDRASTSPASLRSAKRVSGNLTGTDSVTGNAIVDAMNANAAQRKFGPGYRNPNSWQRF